MFTIINVGKKKRVENVNERKPQKISLKVSNATI